MAEIHPNDIGLATFADVGDVEKLKTSAKNLVDALNEIYQNGTQGGSGGLGQQWYVDGENNIILGENNIVYGSDNLIIGSDNVVVGDNIRMIANNQKRCNTGNLNFTSFDAEEKKLYFSVYSDELSTNFKLGEKLVFRVSQYWKNEQGDDYIIHTSAINLVEVTGISDEEQCITIDSTSSFLTPPDDTHIILEMSLPETVILLNDSWKTAGIDSAVSFGGISAGEKSVNAGSGTVSGKSAFAANGGYAYGDVSSALCNGRSYGKGALAANAGSAYGDFSTVLNWSYSYAPYSNCSGYYCRTYGRALKCTAVDWANLTFTIDNKYSLAGINPGDTIVARCYSKSASLVFTETTVKSVENNVIYLTEGSYKGGTGAYIYKLFPDGMIFVVDKDKKYASGSESGGEYSISCGLNTFSHGKHLIAAGNESAMFGKFGCIPDENALALANGTSMSNMGLAFKVLSDGSVHADKEYTSPCADYAEYFEWADGNPNNEDRAGYFVKPKDGKIVLCEDFDTPLGIVSATPAIIGDSGEMHWQGKYATDDFGRIQYHDVTVPAEIDEDGNIVTEEHIETQPILNPQWNPEQEYIPRKDRPEWSAVGVLGKLIVYDDGTLQSGDVCRCGANGKAVKSIENGYTVLKRISDDKVLIWFKG